MPIANRQRFGTTISLAVVLCCGLPAMGAEDHALAVDLQQTCPTCRRIEKGCAQNIAWYARPSNTPSYVGYYVGGGAPFKEGEPRCANEGTWGWDYSGLLMNRRVRLGWWHGQRAQGGTGSYRTDGPRLVQPH